MTKFSKEVSDAIAKLEAAGYTVKYIPKRRQFDLYTKVFCYVPVYSYSRKNLVEYTNKFH